METSKLKVEILLGCTSDQTPTIDREKLKTSYSDKPSTNKSSLFMDFSSAFNTIQPHVLIKKLLNLGVNSDLILWIRQFLSDRPQRVRLNDQLGGECQFKSSFLELNIAKTKELVFGKGKAGNTPTHIYIDNQGVDIVSSFKYLGTFIDTNLTFCDHVDYI